MRLISRAEHGWHFKTSGKIIDSASKALEECTMVSGMDCMLCKTGERSVITVPGPPPPIMVGIALDLSLLALRRILQVLMIITARTSLL